MTRQRTLSVLASALAIPLSAQAPAPKPAAKRAPKAYSIGQFMATTSFGGADFSPDESRLLLHSNQSGIFNAGTVDLKGGAFKPLTDSTKDSTYAVAFLPDGERVLVTRDQGGNELNHLYVREKDGSLKDLTPGAKVKASFNGWAKDSKGQRTGFYVFSNERDPKYIDVYRYDVKDLSRKLIFKNEGFQPGDVSPDGRWLALTKVNSTLDKECHVADLRTGETRQLLAHPGRVADVSPSAFTPDSAGLVVLTNDGSEFSRVVEVRLDSGTAAEIEKADWEVVDCYFSEDGRYRDDQPGASTPSRVPGHGDGQRPFPLPKVPWARSGTCASAPARRRRPST